MVDRHLDALRPLRQLVAGGDVVPLPQARRVLEEIPGCRLINGYGPTENTTFTACRTVSAADAARPSIPIGRPLDNTTVHVLDAALRPVPLGVRGRALHRRAGARARLFRPPRPDRRASSSPIRSPRSPGGRLYRTGDLARWLPDGSLEFLGRIDTQVKCAASASSRARSRPRSAAHPAVAESVVVAREDRPGDRRLVAYLVPPHGGSRRRRWPTSRRSCAAACRTT